MESPREARQLPGPACEECRRRRSRCDRVRPQCGLCAELGRNCITIRKRSQRGPKKGQLEELRSRVATLELILVRQQSLEPSLPPTERIGMGLEGEPVAEAGLYEGSETNGTKEVMAALDFDWSSGYREPEVPNLTGSPTYWDGSCDSLAPPTLSENHQLFDFTPPSSVLGTANRTSIICDGGVRISDLIRVELDLLYFERVHLIAPIIHKSRYFAWTSDPHPPPAKVCLRFAMWTLTTAMSAQFSTLGDALYATTRRLLEAQDVPDAAGQPWMTDTEMCAVELEFIQAWLLLVHYEFLRKPECQAVLTYQRAFRLLQLSDLFETDAPDGGSRARSATSTPSPSDQLPDSDADDWIAIESKRRTLWVAYILDRLASMVNGRQFLLHEEMIRTRLPMPENDYQVGKTPTTMAFLLDALLSETDDGTLSPLAECVVLANIFGRCLTHERLSNAVPLSCSESDSHAFWTRHNWLAAAVDRAHRLPSVDYNLATVSATTASEPPSRSKCDPMRALNQCLARDAVMFFSCTACRVPWQSPEYQAMTEAYREKAAQAASEVVMIMKKAPRIAFLKMHPLISNTITLVVRFLGPDIQKFRNQDLWEGVKGRTELVSALKALAEVNNLAREQVGRIDVNPVLAQSTPPELEIGGFEWQMQTLAHSMYT